MKQKKSNYKLLPYRVEQNTMSLFQMEQKYT